jgi:4a-hydroxytetrahydrobiopterin dehydratase
MHRARGDGIGVADPGTHAVRSRMGEQMDDKLTDEEIAARLAKLDGWERDGNSIARTFELSDFTHALGFVVEVGVIAEGVWHHPNILMHAWNKVTVTCSSHDTGTITKRDVDLADKVNETFAKR